MNRIIRESYDFNRALWNRKKHPHLKGIGFRLRSEGTRRYRIGTVKLSRGIYRVPMIITESYVINFPNREKMFL
jgi:hypothetical protein